jgi:hypothetical protein
VIVITLLVQDFTLSHLVVGQDAGHLGGDRRGVLPVAEDADDGVVVNDDVRRLFCRVRSAW